MKVIWPNHHIFKKRADSNVRELPEGPAEADLDPYLVTEAGFPSFVLFPSPRQYKRELWSQSAWVVILALLLMS